MGADTGPPIVATRTLPCGLEERTGDIDGGEESATDQQRCRRLRFRVDGDAEFGQVGQKQRGWEPVGFAWCGVRGLILKGQRPACRFEDPAISIFAHGDRSDLEQRGHAVRTADLQHPCGKHGTVIHAHRANADAPQVSRAARLGSMPTSVPCGPSVTSRLQSPCGTITRHSTGPPGAIRPAASRALLIGASRTR